jgi:hypothetical protein
LCEEIHRIAEWFKAEAELRAMLDSPARILLFNGVHATTSEDTKRVWKAAADLVEADYANQLPPHLKEAVSRNSGKATPPPCQRPEYLSKKQWAALLALIVQLGDSGGKSGMVPLFELLAAGGGEARAKKYVDLLSAAEKASSRLTGDTAALGLPEEYAVAVKTLSARIKADAKRHTTAIKALSVDTILADSSELGALIDSEVMKKDSLHEELEERVEECRTWVQEALQEFLHERVRTVVAALKVGVENTWSKLTGVPNQTGQGTQANPNSGSSASVDASIGKTVKDVRLKLLEEMASDKFLDRSCNVSQIIRDRVTSRLDASVIGSDSDPVSRVRFQTFLRLQAADVVIAVHDRINTEWLRLRLKLGVPASSDMLQSDLLQHALSAFELTDAGKNASDLLKWRQRRSKFAGGALALLENLSQIAF